MSKIDVLRRNYQRICGLPWDRNVAGPQRVWLAVYDKEDERRCGSGWACSRTPNNAAEPALRHAVIWPRISGETDAESGSDSASGC